MESRPSKTFWFQRLFGRRVFLVLNLIFLGFLLFSFGREFARNWEIQQEIKTLETKAENLQIQHSEIESLMTAAGTETFVEREARLKLGLSKSGENVVIIEEGQISELSGTTSGGSVDRQFDYEATEDSSPTSIANQVKWWYYFFDNNKFLAIKSYGK